MGHSQFLESDHGAGYDLESETSGLTLVLERDLTGLQQYRSELESLARASVEPNVFYEPVLLFPALENYSGKAELIFVLVFHKDLKQAGGPTLSGFFPLQRQRRLHGIPFAHLSMYRYPHCYLSTPLVHKVHAGAVMRLFMDWIGKQRSSRLLRMQQINADGVLHNALERAIRLKGNASTSFFYERSFFRPAASAESYFSAVLSSGFRKELRRKDRRLAECGDVAITQLQSADDLHCWLDEFMQLEASGWKAREGTAMVLSAADRRFFTSMAVDAFRQGRLIMLALRLNGMPLAMQVNILSGQGAYAFKVAYDEDFARYSPGVLLDLALIQTLHARKEVRWLDLCNDDPDMFNRLFTERRKIRNLTVSCGDTLGNIVAQLLPLVKRLRRSSGRT